MKYSPFSIMPQIGTEANPIRMGSGKIKLRGRYLKNEDKKKYDDNYDRIFGRKKDALRDKT
jgi:hypothetical protein